MIASVEYRFISGNEPIFRLFRLLIFTMQVLLRFDGTVDIVVILNGLDGISLAIFFTALSKFIPPFGAVF